MQYFYHVLALIVTILVRPPVVLPQVADMSHTLVKLNDQKLSPNHNLNFEALLYEVPLYRTWLVQLYFYYIDVKLSQHIDLV